MNNQKQACMRKQARCKAVSRASQRTEGCIRCEAEERLENAGPEGEALLPAAAPQHGSTAHARPASALAAVSGAAASTAAFSAAAAPAARPPAPQRPFGPSVATETAPRRVGDVGDAGGKRGGGPSRSGSVGCHASGAMGCQGQSSARRTHGAATAADGGDAAAAAEAAAAVALAVALAVARAVAWASAARNGGGAGKRAYGTSAPTAAAEWGLRNTRRGHETSDIYWRLNPVFTGHAGRFCSGWGWVCSFQPPLGVCTQQNNEKNFPFKPNAPWTTHQRRKKRNKNRKLLSRRQQSSNWGRGLHPRHAP